MRCRRIRITKGKAPSMADICIRCGKQAEGLLCPECAAPPAKKAKVEPAKPQKAAQPVAVSEPVVAPEPVVIAEPIVVPEPVAPPVVKPEPIKAVKEVKAPKPPKPAKAPKPPKPPKAKRVYTDETKQKTKKLSVLALVLAIAFAFLPQIKSGFSASKDFVSSKFSQASAAAPNETPTESASPTPSAEPTESPTPEATEPTAEPTKTKTASSTEVAAGARTAVLAKLKKCAQAIVYAPPGCPFAETIRIHGNSVDWTLAATPKVTFVSDSAGVQTLKVSGTAIAHVHYGEVIRDVEHSFTRTAIATPSGTTYTIKWK